MTVDEIRAMPAGDELDVATAVHVVGWRDVANGSGRITGVAPAGYLDRFASAMHTEDVIPYYSHDWAVISDVIESVKAWDYAGRMRFMTTLADQLRTPSGDMIRWPDAVLFLEPAHVCRAALMVVALVEGKKR